MNGSMMRWVVGLTLFAGGALRAATIYVATNGTHDVVNRFDTWGGAATNIHDAVAIATNGDSVLVGNGVYRTTNTLVVAMTGTVQSLNGPDVTTLQPTGGAFHVMTVTNASALVAGFTLRGGGGAGNYTPRALFLHSGTVSNCVITGNSGGSTVELYGKMTHCVISNNPSYSRPLWVYGGGLIQNSRIAYNAGVECAGMIVAAGGTGRFCRVYNNTTGNYGPTITLNGRLENSLVYSNTVGTLDASAGVSIAGAAAVMDNCTVVGNRSPYAASGGAGVKRTGGIVRNCILFGNSGPNPANYSGAASAVSNSCAPDLASGVQGNVKGDPCFVNAATNDFRLRVSSPCRDSGMTLAAVTQDIDGVSRPLDGGAGLGARYDMGVYEMDGTGGPFEVGFYGVEPLAGLAPFTVVFRANVVGTDRTVAWYGWDFNGDGIYETNGAGLATVTNTFAAGRYSVSLLASNTLGAVSGATNLDYVSVVSAVLYVATNGLSQFPYDTPSKAATNINDATDSAVAGCTVYVGDGTFGTTKRIVLLQDMRVLGNGPAATTVRRNTAAGNFGVFSLEHATAFLSGMTITNGYGTTTDAGAIRIAGGTVSNCLVTKTVGSGYWCVVTIGSASRMTSCAVSNNAGYSGAVYLSAGGTIEDSQIMGNSGVDRGGLNIASGATARRCRIIGNWATYKTSSGGVDLGGSMVNCLVYGNYSTVDGIGGVSMSGGTMVNCTVASNVSAAAITAGSGVGRTGGVITNCVIYGNLGSNGSNYVGTVSAAWYSCAPELTNAAQGNITVDPLFRKPSTGDYRLAAGSPCRNKGWTYAGAAADLDLTRGPRVLQGAIDMGAYELAPPSGTVIQVR